MKSTLLLGQYCSHGKPLSSFSLEYPLIKPNELSLEKGPYCQQENNDSSLVKIAFRNFTVHPKKSYYFSFIIDRIDYAQSVEVFLFNEITKNRQKVYEFELHPLGIHWKPETFHYNASLSRQKNIENYQTFQDEQERKRIEWEEKARQQEIGFLFTPFGEFTHIGIELVSNQNSNDLVSQENRGSTTEVKTSSTQLHIALKRFAYIKNIIPTLPGNPTPSVLIKFGIQSYPGLIMAINGNEFHVGKSGIYEMSYPIQVSSLGFVLKERTSEESLGPLLDPNDFIIDYQY